MTVFLSYRDGQPDEIADAPTIKLIRESIVLALIRGLEIYVFIAGLILVGEAFWPLAARYIPMFGRSALFWLNTVSAAMDNATLVALEIQVVGTARAREVLIALLVAGGMLVPGNIPNIVASSALQIRARDWANIGVPLGLVLLAVYFILLQATN
jgi:predicted cation transporter